MKIKIIKKCKKCGKEFSIERLIINGIEKIPKKEKQNCSRKCANSHVFTDERRKNISEGLKRNTKPNVNKGKFLVLREDRTCPICNSTFTESINSTKKYCSIHCRMVNAGRISAQKNCRRSKNEIYFYELCNEKFSNVIHNEQIFNGWDADVILQDLKIAILWNGKWHYEKITKNIQLSKFKIEIV